VEAATTFAKTSGLRRGQARLQKENAMPVSYIDIPAGVTDSAKEKMVKEVYEAIHDAWPIPDTRILVREWPFEAVSQDGRVESTPMRPICALDVPPGLAVEAKRALTRRISTAIAEACGREVEDVQLPSGTQVKTNWVLTFFREYPLDRAALGDLLATENPVVLESLGGAPARATSEPTLGS
jgi:phenylpyruvate tautomerase PptA (4-oxalocrotonate tautomerase family)